MKIAKYAYSVNPVEQSTVYSGAPISVVFGGNGFVGLHLTRKLQKLGHYVVVGDLNINEDHPANESYICDVRNRIQLDLPQIPQYVFNLAAVHRTPGHEDREYYETNVSGAINVTKWCENVGADTIIFTSSISVYGLQEGTIDESTAPSPNSSYGYSKLFAEEIHKLWQAKSPLDRTAIIVRPAVIFGPGENGNFTRLARALRFGYFIIPSGREVLKPSGWIGDLINSMIFSLKMKENLVLFNFGFPKTYNIGEICDAFETTCKVRRTRSIPLQRILLSIKLPSKSYRKLVARVEKLSNSVQISPNYLLQNGFIWDHDLKSALSEWRDTNCIDEIFDQRT